MWYAIMSEDLSDSLAKRDATRSAHLKRLEELRRQDRLLLAGPHPAIDAETPGPAGFSGSLVVAEFASLGATNLWADADPYVVTDVYARVTVKPFLKVLP